MQVEGGETEWLIFRNVISHVKALLLNNGSWTGYMSVDGTHNVHSLLSSGQVAMKCLRCGSTPRMWWDKFCSECGALLPCYNLATSMENTIACSLGKGTLPIGRIGPRREVNINAQIEWKSQLASQSPHAQQVLLSNIVLRNCGQGDSDETLKDLNEVL